MILKQDVSIWFLASLDEKRRVLRNMQSPPMETPLLLAVTMAM
jgi:hypothetical protein